MQAQELAEAEAETETEKHVAEEVADITYFTVSDKSWGRCAMSRER